MTLIDPSPKMIGIKTFVLPFLLDFLIYLYIKYYVKKYNYYFYKYFNLFRIFHNEALVNIMKNQNEHDNINFNLNIMEIVWERLCVFNKVIQMKN